MSELSVLEIVGSVLEAELVCSILRDGGIKCMQRVTNAGSGAADGLTMGGPREVVVRTLDLPRARELVAEQRESGAPDT
jgi:hypothetical protein